MGGGLVGMEAYTALGRREEGIPVIVVLAHTRQRYVVRLTAAARARLTELLLAGSPASPCLRARTRILLLSDQGPGGPGWTDQRIAEAVTVGPASVRCVRRRFAEAGLVAALYGRRIRRPGPSRRAPRRRRPEGSRSDPTAGRSGVAAGTSREAVGGLSAR